MMKGGGIRYDRSYGAESVENVESAKNERGSSEISEQESSLLFARGVTWRAARNELSQE